MEKEARIYVASADKMIGAAIARRLKARGYANIVGADGVGPDLADQAAVAAFFAAEQPQYTFLAAGKSGGIMANQQFSADLIYNNLMTECNVIHCAHNYGVRKLLYLASSCVYPKHCPQPMHPDSLMTGQLEPTNEAYAVAKLAGLQLCAAYRQQYGDAFIGAIPADVFGPKSHFDPRDSHVIPALIYKMYQAKEVGDPIVELWGTGAPRREFVYADDMADACIFVMESYNGAAVINLGGGMRISIGELAEAIKEVVEYEGDLVFDTTRPDGMPIKGLDADALLGMGWRPQVDFYLALRKTYEWFLQTERNEVSNVK